MDTPYVSARPNPLNPGNVRSQLLDVLGGFLRTQALHTAARLGVADIVGHDPVMVEELAARVEADPSALHRVMRLLASGGIFCEVAPAAFVSTVLSDGLRSDRPGSVRYMAMLQGSDGYLAASEMLRCVQTGEPAAETVFGMPFFEHLAGKSDASDVFNRAMASGASARAAAALRYDWSGASVVADIGGGNGSLLSALLNAQTHLSGVVFDLPNVIAEARPVIEAARLSDRCELVGGDFFSDALPAADVYVLAQILHDWDDERAVAILRNCRRSLAKGARLLLIEQVLPEGDEPSYAKLLDLLMLVLLGGKERTEGEWRALLRDGGFELVGITPTPATSLIEATPA
jgi:hypothetical protein